MNTHEFQPQSQHPTRCKICNKKKEDPRHITEKQPTDATTDLAAPPLRSIRALEANTPVQLHELKVFSFHDRQPPEWPTLLLFFGHSDVKHAKYYCTTGFFYPKYRPMSPCVKTDGSQVTDEYSLPTHWAEAPQIEFPQPKLTEIRGVERNNG